MRRIFIVNPVAGPKNSVAAVEAAINSVKSNEEIEVYKTNSPGDATKYVRSLCAGSDEQLRFYACGGDGTLLEVVNGAADYPNAAVGCFPCGSGNDFVKCYGGTNGFLNIDDQLAGTEQEIDLISVDGRYCVNVCNFGFDAAVATTMQNVKNKLFFKGKMAYFAGIAKAFVKDMRTRCSIVADGELISDGDMLLCTVANGQYVGSSFRCAPRALLDDGELELCLVKPISRPRFVSLIGAYTKGEHLDDERFRDIIVYRRCKRVEVTAYADAMPYSLDGEIENRKSFVIEAIARKLRFIVPRGLTGPGEAAINANELSMAK